ncbi:MAG: hypothetical protein RLP13_15265 [Cytophagales bacterium]
MKKMILILTLLTIGYNISYGQIIDMHMHSYTEKDFWVGTARNGLESSQTAKETLEQTIQKMNEHNIEYAVVCGSLGSIELYTKTDKRFIPAYQDSEEKLIPIKQFEEYVKSGKIKVFAEVMVVYKGKTLADSIYQPYLEICEKYEIPVGYHSGGSFPNAQQLGWPNYRISLGDPLFD